jgi:hypothetical protein
MTTPPPSGRPSQAPPSGASVRPPSPSGTALENCFHDPITARRASTLPPPQKLASLPPHPVLLALEAQRRPSMRPSAAPPSTPSKSPSKAPSAPSLEALDLQHGGVGVTLPSQGVIPWAKVALVGLVIPALVAVASWFYYI